MVTRYFLLFFIFFSPLQLRATSYIQNMSLENDYSRIFKQGFTTEISGFTTDGCSAFPDGFIPTQTNEWLHCCIKHDIDYWIGGEEKLRTASDKSLGHCVANGVGSVIGLSMNIGVTIGGAPSSLPWKWAYGWGYPIEYDNLIELQLKSAAAKYDSVIDVIIGQRRFLDRAQFTSVVIKIKSKLLELYSFLDDDKKKRDEEYKRLKKRIDDITY